LLGAEHGRGYLDSVVEDESNPGRDEDPSVEDDEAPAASTAPPAKPSWKKRATSYALQALVVVVILWGVTWYQARRLLPARVEAPGFALSSLGGDAHRLSDVRGRKVVLYFFAPWCTVCEFSSHNIRALRNARTDEELAIYAVGLGWEEPGELVQFAKDHELNVPVLKGGPAVQRAYRIDTFPSVYIIDEQGRIEDRVVGYTTELGLRLRSL
jgi:peroxiredoxin